jgi:hypothetical protein
MSYSIHAEYSRWDEADDRLVIVGKGIAWSRAEDEVRTFIEGTQIPFPGSPMGKGVMPNLRIAWSHASASDLVTIPKISAVEPQMHQTRGLRGGERLFGAAGGSSSPLTGGCPAPARSRLRSASGILARAARSAK